MSCESSYFSRRHFLPRPPRTHCARTGPRCPLLTACLPACLPAYLVDGVMSGFQVRGLVCGVNFGGWEITSTPIIIVVVIGFTLG